MKRTLTFYSFHSRSGSVKNSRDMLPSESVIRNILNYSRALQVLKTEKFGIVNLIMN
jgi:hypothetical protein